MAGFLLRRHDMVGLLLSCGLWENPDWIAVVTWAKDLREESPRKPVLGVKVNTEQKNSERKKMAET